MPLPRPHPLTTPYLFLVSFLPRACPRATGGLLLLLLLLSLRRCSPTTFSKLPAVSLHAFYPTLKTVSRLSSRRFCRFFPYVLRRVLSVDLRSAITETPFAKLYGARREETNATRGKAGKRRRTGNRRPLRFARISRRLDTLDRAAAGELQQLQVRTYNCIGRGRRVVVQFTIQDDLNDPGPRQPGAKCRQTVVAGSARCIFMILFFF